MSRAVRIEFDGACYHVMSRGVARMPTFLDDDDRMHFLDVVGDLVDQGVLAVHAFCLMPNHFHLLLSTQGGGPGSMDAARQWRLCAVVQPLSPAGRSFMAGEVQGDRGGGWEISRGVLQVHSSESQPGKDHTACGAIPVVRSYRNYVGGPRVVRWVWRRDRYWRSSEWTGEGTGTTWNRGEEMNSSICSSERRRNWCSEAKPLRVGSGRC